MESHMRPGFLRKIHEKVTVGVRIRGGLSRVV
jgi:hypothetical protein